MNQSEDQYEYQALRIASICSSALTFIGCFFIIWTFSVIKGIRNMLTFRLILYLTISDLILTTSGLIGAVPNISDNYCIIIAAVMEYGRMSSLFWSFILSKVIYDTLTTEVLRTDQEIKYLLFAYGVPLVFAIPPGLIGWFGQAGAYCWVSFDLSPLIGTIAVTVEFYGFWLIGIIVMIYYFRKMLIIIKRNHGTTYASNSPFNLLYYYPWILMFCWLLPCIDRYYIAIWHGNSLILRVLNVTGGQIQGFLNSLIYITNTYIKLRLKNHLKKYCLGSSLPISHADSLSEDAEEPNGNRDIYDQM